MRCPAALLALGGACLLLAANAQVLSTLKSLDFAPAGFNVSQQSVSYQSLIAKGTITTAQVAQFEIPATDPLVAPAPGLTQYTPDQVHISLADNGTIFITWATGTYINYTTPSSNYVNGTGVYAPQFPDPASVASVVEWGLTTGGPYSNVATGMTRAYIQTYLHDSATYVSQLFHTVNVRNLPFGQTVYYKVGDPSKELSVEYSITLATSLAPSNTYTYPLTLGVVADVGQTFNSSVTYQHLVASKPDAVIFIGDLAYADDYNDKGGGPTSSGPGVVVSPPTNSVRYAGTTSNQGQTWQPRWDTMTRLLSRSGNGTSIPYSFLPGNHEIERDEQLRSFQGFTNRYPSPYQASYSTNPLYYSQNIGPVHNIMLNSYDSYLPNVTLDETSAYLSALSPQNSLILFGNGGGSGINGTGMPAFVNGNYIYSALGPDQLSWFLNDLARVNRAVTPWVTVSWHQPPYNSYTTHFKEAECLRQQVEPFLYNFGVDIVFHGHVHAYERNYQTFNYQQNGCAPRWITIGDGGNQEGLYTTFAGVQCAAGNTQCGQPTFGGTYTPAPGGLTNPAGCITYQNGTYAPVNAAQPGFSAYREPSFGHGVMTVFNATTALWQWNRNLDGTAVNTDSVYFIRNPQCNNFKTGTPLPPTPTPSPPATLAPSPAGKPNIIQQLLDADQAIQQKLSQNLILEQKAAGTP